MARSEPTTADRADNGRTNARELVDGAVVLSSKPTRAWLSITGKCNLLCTHCPRSLVDEQYLSAAEMTPAVLDRVRAEVLPSVQVLRIGGNNLGEQLFARSWSAFAGRLDRDLTPWLITNAQTMNASRIAEMVDAGYVIDVSIDAASEPKYRQIRGASLAKLVDHVRAIVAERERRRHDATSRAGSCRVLFSFTAFADNIDELPALVRLAIELGIDGVVVTHYMPSIEAQRYQSLFYHQSAANRAFADARAIAAGSTLELTLPPDYPVPTLGAVEALRITVRDRYGRPLGRRHDDDAPPQCAHPWTSVSINEKGDVYPCCQSNLLMGNLANASFEEIWNNARYRKLRRTVNSRRPLPDCRRCVLRGSTFTSTDCAEGSFFLRNLDLPTWVSTAWRDRARRWFARTRSGRWLWHAGRAAYKNFFEWHMVPR